MMKRIHKVNEKLVIMPEEAVFDGNQRKIITVKLESNVKAVVIGINPSTAHDGKSDVTLTKISRYLDSYGVGEISMINLFDTVSTQQSGIDYTQHSNLEQFEELIQKADLIVIAWGTENTYTKQKQSALTYLQPFRNKMYCIEDEHGKKPRHPSRIKYSYPLVRFKV